MDASQIPQIGRDLEERNKQLTLQQLKRQGEAYHEFNQQILSVVDEAASSTEESSERLRDEFRNIETGAHFENKFNIDGIIAQRFGHIVRDVMH